MNDKLPFSPLTHSELNRRADLADMEIARWVRAVVRMEGGLAINERDEARILGWADEGEAYQDAAMVRCEVTA